MVNYDCDNCGTVHMPNVKVHETDDGDVLIVCVKCKAEVIPEFKYIERDDGPEAEEFAKEMEIMLKEYNDNGFYIAMQQLLAKGIVEVAGIGPDGIELYQLTPKGKEIYANIPEDIKQKLNKNNE